MRTLKIPYYTDNKSLIDEYNYHYTGLFYKMYNNKGLMKDRAFMDNMLNEYIDRSIYNFCTFDVKAKLSKTETDIKNNKKEIKDIDALLKENDFKTKKEKREKYKLIRKKNRLLRNIEKDIAFGSKYILRKITKTHNNIKNIKLFDSDNKDKLKEKEDLLEKYKSEFKNGRSMGMYLIGNASENGNRKIGFDLRNKKITFKPNRKNKAEIIINPKKEYYNILCKIQDMIDLKLIPVTIRIMKDHICLSYDEELLSGFSFNVISCKKEQSLCDCEEEKKDIYKKYKSEQDERKLKGKIANRYCGVDLNPEYIGLSIVDKKRDNGNKGDFDIVYQECIDLSKMSKKLNVSSDNKKQLKQNNKRKHEIREVWKHVFNLLTHYKVGYFVMEDLDFKPNKKNENKGKEFNRKTKNIWHRELTKNLIVKHCNTKGIMLIEVNPCYSSFIGNMIYDVFDPISASLEVVRRGIVKYIKGSSIYPDISRINQEKLTYLLGENIDLSGLTWKNIYENSSLSRYRNLSKDKLIDKKLYSIKSKVKILTC